MKVAADPLIGRVLGGRYRLERLLGAGGMGAVFAAVQLHIDRPVAIKMLVGDVEPKDVERLRIEAFAAASLGHPNIVHVIDFLPATEDHPACLVMERLSGRSLAAVLLERAALPVPLALHVAREMLDALAAAHSAGIVHRDVKPANVMVLDGGDPGAPRIKVIDFGLAKLMDHGSRQTTTGTVLGTPSFMAPEQHLALPPTPAVDVWAMGVCLYEMLAGERPFRGTIVDIFDAVTKGPPPDLAKAAPHVPQAIVDVVTRALTRDPNGRFADAAAMRAALDPPPPPAPAPPPARRAARAFLLAMTSGVLVAMLISGVVVSFSRRATPARGASADAKEEGDAAAPVSPLVEPREPAPPASASAAPSSTSLVAKGVPCVCMESIIPVCPQPMVECQCVREEAGTICLSKWPNGKCPMSDYQRPGRVDRSGEACRGWSHVLGDGGQWYPEPMEGTFRCSNGCGRTWALDHPTIAVPGTPCRGFVGTTPTTGTWVKILR